MAERDSARPVPHRVAGLLEVSPRRSHQGKQWRKRHLIESVPDQDDRSHGDGFPKSKSWPLRVRPLARLMHQQAWSGPSRGVPQG